LRSAPLPPSSAAPPPPTSTLFPYTTLFRSRSRPRHLRPHRKRPEAGNRRRPGDHPCRARAQGETVRRGGAVARRAPRRDHAQARSEEHTSELQSRENLVCRLLLEKKK